MSENAKPLQWITAVAEYLGGALDEPPAGFRLALDSAIWAVWWALLVVLLMLFSGQTSKFIYVDF